MVTMVPKDVDNMDEFVSYSDIAGHQITFTRKEQVARYNYKKLHPKI